VEFRIKKRHQTALDGAQMRLEKQKLARHAAATEPVSQRLTNVVSMHAHHLDLINEGSERATPCRTVTVYARSTPIVKSRLLLQPSPPGTI
jgi:hypothetical protein